MSIENLQKIESFIPVEGDYQIILLAESTEATVQFFKIATNDEHQLHVDAPKPYSSFEEATNRVEELELRNQRQVPIDNLQKVETFLPVEGDYQIIVLAESKEAAIHHYKIVTNDRQQLHVDSPVLYSTLEDAMARVEELEQNEPPG